MAAHRKPRRLVPLVAALCVLVGAAVGGYVLTGSTAPETVNLASSSAASSQHVTVTACLTPGKLTRISVQWPASRPVPAEVARPDVGRPRSVTGPRGLARRPHPASA